MANDQQVALLTGDEIANRGAGVVGSKAGDHLELREWIARPVESFRCLAGAELAAVPDCRRHGSRRTDLIRKPFGLLMPEHRQGPLWIDVWPDGVRVVNEKKDLSQFSTPGRRLTPLAFSPRSVYGFPR
jgi:hypothetical protein